MDEPYRGERDAVERVGLTKRVSAHSAENDLVADCERLLEPVFPDHIRGEAGITGEDAARLSV